MNVLEHSNKKERKTLSKERFEPGLTKVLKEMCQRVGADYESMNFKEDKWFYKHSWTLEEEKNFEKWLYDNKDPEVNKNLGLSKNRYFRERQIAMFVLNYGWKLTNEVETN